MSNIPVDYHFENLFNARFSPSSVHCKNTALVNFYSRYLFQKLISIYEWQNLPEEWPENYFTYVLFGYGYIAIFDTDEFGVICNECGLSGYDVFYQPTTAMVANPILGTRKLSIGDDCELIKVQPDYGTVLDIIGNYADLMAMSLETAAINLLNSKLSYVFTADNKSAAESFKKLYDQIASGEPAAVVDQKLIGADGEKRWDLFTQNVGQNYITDKILNDMRTIENQFNTEIGIPNANTQKRERLITDEVNANNMETQSKVLLWLSTMRKCIAKVNERYSLNIAVNYRYEAPVESEEVIEDAE